MRAGVLFGAAALVSLLVARVQLGTSSAFDLGIGDALRALLAPLGLGDPLDDIDQVVARGRIVDGSTAALVGASLAVSGALLQGLFRNPLASPGLVGVTSGASLGAVLGLLAIGGVTDELLGGRGDLRGLQRAGAVGIEAVAPLRRQGGASFGAGDAGGLDLRGVEHPGAVGVHPVEEAAARFGELLGHDATVAVGVEAIEEPGPVAVPRRGVEGGGEQQHERGAERGRPQNASRFRVGQGHDGSFLVDPPKGRRRGAWSGPAGPGARPASRRPRPRVVRGDHGQRMARVERHGGGFTRGRRGSVAGFRAARREGRDRPCAGRRAKATRRRKADASHGAGDAASPLFSDDVVS